jgi:hypothetical protein
MSKPVGELTIDPEPSPAAKCLERVDYSLVLETELEKIPPRTLATRVKLGSAALINLYAQYGAVRREPSFGFNATVSYTVSENYRQLGDQARSQLVCEVKEAMAQQAHALNPTKSFDHYFDESTALMEHNALFFEPHGNAMLRGSWWGIANSQLRFEANDPMTDEQRRILLGGFAVFITELA